jgi:hypothetical protein
MIPHLLINKSDFVIKHTGNNLLEDIKTICFDLNLSIGDISMQRDRVLALNDAIKRTIDIYKSKNDYNTFQLLKGFKYFILTTNRSNWNFSIEIQILLNGSLTIFPLRG